METHLADFIRETPDGREAEEILRKCVHCGFCTATCPTYQLFGDELDSPRGRIYLIKQVLEGTAASARTRLHLDRCLTCRACETTCPSGVQYGRLLDIGRGIVATQAPRSPLDGAIRATLRQVLPRPGLFAPAVKIGQQLRPLLPRSLRAKVPPVQQAGSWPAATHGRHMLVLAGCVQPTLLPNINSAAARVLDRLGIGLHEIVGAGCCGAVSFHLDDVEGAKAAARRNIDAWWPAIEAGSEAIVVTASGCGTQIKDYGRLLSADPHYAEKAARVGALAKDVGEVIANEADRLHELLAECPSSGTRLAFHSPCSLQHGQKIRGLIEPLLVAAGFELTVVVDSHLCCGSAGTYSLLQPAIANRLRADKLTALSAGRPAAIASANVGCIAHLQAGSDLPVRHWIELLDQSLESGVLAGASSLTDSASSIGTVRQGER
jgi:glycolate oxidase iron-sulfur subunit